METNSYMLLNVNTEWLKGQRKPQGSSTGVQRSVEVLPPTTKSLSSQNLKEPHDGSSVVGSDSGGSM